MHFTIIIIITITIIIKTRIYWLFMTKNRTSKLNAERDVIR